MMLRAAAVLLTLAGFVVLLSGASIATAQGVAPGTPDKPTGEAIFRGGVDLQWNEVLEAEFYDVEFYRGGPIILLPNDGVEIDFYGPGAVISGLNHTGPTYHFRVRAGNQHGSSEWSGWTIMGTTNEQVGGQRERPANARATGAPTIRGTSRVGETLTASNSGIEDDNGLGRVTFSYQWVANDGTTDTDLTDATEASYTPAAPDENKTIKVRVSFTDRGGYSESLTSSATGAIAPPVSATATGAPRIIGTPWVGETLTASISDIEDDNGLDGVAFAYQWITGDGNTEEDIEGATGAEYTLLAADEGRVVKVRVSFTDNHGFTETLTSAATAAVATTPGAPGNLNVTSGDNWELAATWEPPASDGGSAVISYRVQWKSGSKEYDGRTGSARQVVVTGLSSTIAELTHGVEYTVRVIATNGVGDGAAAEATATSSDTAPPQISTATVNGRILELGYNEGLDKGSVPGASAFSVTVSGAARGVQGVSVARREVTLILGSAVTGSDTVTVSYSAPSEVSEPRIRDAIGNAAGSFSDETARSNTHPGAPSAPTISEPAVPHGSTLDTATVLTLGAAVSGRIDPAGDEDYFEIVLAEAAGLLVRTTGDLNTTGELLDSNGAVIARNDDGRPGEDANFVIWQSLPAGAYYIRVGGDQAAAGLYQLHAEAIPDTSSRSDARLVQLNQPANGMVDPRGDEDLYKIELSEAADLLVRTGGDLDTEGALLDSEGSVIAKDNQAGNFSIRRSLEAGVYYIKVGGFRGDPGPYTLHVDAVAELGRTMATASPLTLGVPAGGRFDESGAADYFSIVTGSTTDLVVRVLGILTTRTLFDSDGERVAASRLQDELYEGTDTRWRNLPAGSYYLKVVDDDSGISGENGGLYTVIADDGSDYERFITRCSNIDTEFDDPLYGCQWHLSNTEKNEGAPGEDINVEEAWAAGHLGEGITVAVVDNGVDSHHEDLRANVRIKLNHYYDGGFQGHWHGTAVAGIIAALANGSGGRGVAPEATIYSYDLTETQNYNAANRADAMARNADITAVSNNSWGDFAQGSVNRAGSRWEAAVADGVTTGYGGKGVFYVFAAGNGHLDGDLASLDEFMTFYAVTAVCAVDNLGLRASYSETGDNLWVCAPAAEVTTDTDNRYRSTLGGTSATAPIVSGVAALVRGANPELTWRDVKLILAASARKNDATNSGWETGALRYGSTTERYTFNREYGFGVVDAKAAVDLAESWTNLPPMKSDSAESGALSLAVPDRVAGADPATVASELTLGPKVGFTEFVEVNIKLDHPSLRDLDIELRSPAGTVSKLTVADGGIRNAGLRSSFRFGSARHLGEDPSGVWTLRVTDRIAGREGSITRWNIKVYGHHPSAAAGAPTITGTVQVGETLTADTSAIEDADGLTNTTFTYQWLADDTELQGATNSTYTLADGDEGKTVKVQVSFTDDAGKGETLTSEATDAVAAAAASNTPATGTPTISGTAQVGETLTADTSGIADTDGLENATFSYQWLADDITIEEATDFSYTLLEADKGKAIKVRVSFTDDEGNEEEMTSGTTDAVSAAPTPNSPATGAPTIGGTAQVGETLTAVTSGIADEDGMDNASFAYQWLADDADISGATGSTYGLSDADAGQAIKVRVSFTDDEGNEETLTSVATDAVAAAEPTEPAEPPPAPTSLTAVVNDDGTVTLSWDAPDDDSVTGYQILRRRPTMGEDKLLVYVADTGGTATTFTDTDVTEGVRHVYRVKAINAAGLGKWSNYVRLEP